jgi:hypothetical protein
MAFTFLANSLNQDLAERITMEATRMEYSCVLEDIKRLRCNERREMRFQMYETLRSVIATGDISSLTERIIKRSILEPKYGDISKYNKFVRRAINEILQNSYVHEDDYFP